MWSLLEKHSRHAQLGDRLLYLVKRESTEMKSLRKKLGIIRRVEK